MEDFKIKEFDFEEEFKKIKEELKKPNILICGATGVGKSTIINEFFGEELARVNDGKPETRGIKKYEKSDKNIIIYDSEGYEVGNENLTNFKENIIGYIDYKRDENTDVCEHIHLVWYAISAANKRISDLDISTIKEIKSKNVSLCIILTKIDSVDIEELEDLEKVIKSEIKGVKYFKFSNDDDVPKEYIDKDKLIDWSMDNLDESLKNGFISALDYKLEGKRNLIKKRIIKKYANTAMCIGAVPIPIPDSLPLISLQTTMASHILSIWGIEKIKGAMESLVGSTIISQCGKFLARESVAKVLKFIPGCGSIAGGIINGMIAKTFTSALGNAISELCFRYANALKDDENVDILEIFNSDSIIQLINFYLKDQFNKKELEVEVYE